MLRILNMMQQIQILLRKILAVVCVMVMGALVCAVTWQVFSRYVLSAPSSITEELSTILFVWMVLLSAAYLFGEIGGHMNMGIISDKAKGNKKLVLDILSQFAILWFAIFVLIRGGSMAVINCMKQVNSAIPFITIGQIYIALPICGYLTAYFSIYFIIRDIFAYFVNRAESLGRGKSI